MDRLQFSASQIRRERERERERRRNALGLLWRWNQKFESARERQKLVLCVCLCVCIPLCWCARWCWQESRRQPSNRPGRKNGWFHSYYYAAAAVNWLLISQIDWISIRGQLASNLASLAAAGIRQCTFQTIPLDLRKS